MKERAIYYLSGIITGILLCAVLWSFTGKEHEQEVCSFEIIDCNFVMSDPNEASYKAFFGWE